MRYLKLFEEYTPENLTTLGIEHQNKEENLTFNNNKNLILLIDDIKELKFDINEFFKVYARLYRRNIILTDEELNRIRTIQEIKNEYLDKNKLLNLKNLLISIKNIINTPLENRETHKISTYNTPSEIHTLKKEYRAAGNGFKEISRLKTIYSDIDVLSWRAKQYINSYDKVYHYKVELDDEQIKQLKALYKELDNYKKTGIVNIKDVYDNLWCLLNINYDTTQNYKRLHGVKTRKYIPQKNITNKK